MNGASMDKREAQPRTRYRRHAFLPALSLVLLTSAIGAALLQAVLSPQLLA